MPNFVYFFLAVAALLLGYFVYGTFVEKMFGVDHSRPTPAKSMADGVDYVEMHPAKVFLIQLLNIAGVGPVFGPILGAYYGPSALVWIVIGCIFAGGVHDYFSGMMSLRYHGKSLPDVVGYTLGSFFKQFMRAFSIVLLLLVGVVFVTAPAGLLASLTPDWLNFNVWVIIIFGYYFLATILPIDVIIGRLYPLFAVVLVVMAVGVAGGLIAGGHNFYSWAEWTNQHPKGLPIWPLMFVTIACGAISGFHATQSPLMARCLPLERQGKPIFYGSMIAEGIIALIWATAGMTFYQSPELLAGVAGGPGGVVREVCMTLLGPIGGVLAILGVVVLPITSGDTAFRAARLVIADFSKSNQTKIPNRLLIAIPLFVIGAALSQINFDVIWRYFGWSNQTLAAVVLWAAAAYAVKRGVSHWFISLPATFLTSVVSTYILNQKMGFGLDYNISIIGGAALAIGALALFLAKQKSIREHAVLELPIPEQQARKDA